jgi:iron complex transport system permease protein
MLLVCTIVIASGIGPYPIPPQSVLQAIGARLLGEASQNAIGTVLFNIRLPRIAAAGLVGAALAAAGAAYQSLFRNPLVSPDILGVSTGAGSRRGRWDSARPAGGHDPIARLWRRTNDRDSGRGARPQPAWRRRRARSRTCGNRGRRVGRRGDLAGQGAADPYDQLPAITFWLLGSLAGVKASDVAATAPIVLLRLAPLVLLRWRIGVLSLGDDEARALGVEVGRLRGIVIVAATLITASVVAISGVIGWVGLMVPHMARLMVGPRFDRLLPAAILLGAAFMIGVDTLARSAARIEIPLGILTAMIGGPTFVWLLAHHRR